jgi:hypothetical protein
MFDTKVVHQSDIGQHFLLNQERLGCNQAEACCKLLMELKPSSASVNGHNNLLYLKLEECDDLHGLRGWEALVCVQRPKHAEQSISGYGWDFYVPTALVQTCGLVATIWLQIWELSSESTHYNIKLTQCILNQHLISYFGPIY